MRLQYLDILCICINHILHPKYSKVKNAKILFKFSTVFLSIILSLSSTVCQHSGNGYGIICKIGTLKREKEKNSFVNKYFLKTKTKYLGKIQNKYLIR